jgi:hypothetical protein
MFVQEAFLDVDPARVPADVVDRLTALAEQRMSYPGTESGYLEALHRTLRALVAPARYEATVHAIRQTVQLLAGSQPAMGIRDRRGHPLPRA